MYKSKKCPCSTPDTQKADLYVHSFPKNLYINFETEASNKFTVKYIFNLIIYKNHRTIYFKIHPCAQGLSKQRKSQFLVRLGQYPES